jgi:hypothetical protein
MKISIYESIVTLQLMQNSQWVNERLTDAEREAIRMAIDIMERIEDSVPGHIGT